MSVNAVVPKPEPLSEDDFHQTFMLCLSRMVKRHGKAKVAQWMEISVRQLGNIQSGSTPGARSMFNLLAHDPGALDELHGEYDLRAVGKGSVCSEDPLTVAMITFAGQVAEAECPEGHGGQKVTDHEILHMDESLLRKVNRVTGTWIARLDAMRRPRAVNA